MARCLGWVQLCVICSGCRSLFFCLVVRFSLAAAVVGMMSFAECRLHRKTVLEVDCFVVVVVVVVFVSTHFHLWTGSVLRQSRGSRAASGSSV